MKRNRNKKNNKTGKVKNMATLEEKAVASYDGTLTQRFEQSILDFAQDTVSAKATLTMTAEKRYSLCVKVQAEPNFMTIAAKKFLNKALSKDEITVSPDPAAATDTEINTSVASNMFDDDYVDFAFFRRFTF